MHDIHVHVREKFEIDAVLIPENGRTLECGSCGQNSFIRKN